MFYPPHAPGGWNKPVGHHRCSLTWTGLPRLANRYHVSTVFKAVQIVRPRLHHLAALGKILGAIVGGARRIAFGVGKLSLDGVP